MSVVTTPGNKKFCLPLIKMVQIPQNTIMIYDQNSKTLQGWRKPKCCQGNKIVCPIPLLQANQLPKTLSQLTIQMKTIIILKMLLFTLLHNMYGLLTINGHEMYIISAKIYLNLIGKGESVVKFATPKIVSPQVPT
jgi:hypothetical protein